MRPTTSPSRWKWLRFCRTYLFISRNELFKLCNLANTVLFFPRLHFISSPLDNAATWGNKLATLIKILGSEIFFCFGRTPGDSSRHWRDNTNEHFKFEIAREIRNTTRNPLAVFKKKMRYFLPIGLNEQNQCFAFALLLLLLLLLLISAKVKQSQWRAVVFIWTVTRLWGADCR